jgi:hypothetical protein
MAPHHPYNMCAPCRPRFFHQPFDNQVRPMLAHNICDPCSSHCRRCIPRPKADVDAQCQVHNPCHCHRRGPPCAAVKIRHSGRAAPPWPPKALSSAAAKNLGQRAGVTLRNSCLTDITNVRVGVVDTLCPRVMWNSENPASGC